MTKFVVWKKKKGQNPWMFYSYEPTFITEYAWSLGTWKNGSKRDICLTTAI